MVQAALVESLHALRREERSARGTRPPDSSRAAAPERHLGNPASSRCFFHVTPGLQAAAAARFDEAPGSGPPTQKRLQKGCKRVTEYPGRDRAGTHAAAMKARLWRWCRRWDSNPHSRCIGKRFLRPSRLPFRHFGTGRGASRRRQSFHADPRALHRGPIIIGGRPPPPAMARHSQRSHAGAAGTARAHIIAGWPPDALRSESS